MCPLYLSSYLTDDVTTRNRPLCNIPRTLFFLLLHSYPRDWRQRILFLSYPLTCHDWYSHPLSDEVLKVFISIQLNWFVDFTKLDPRLECLGITDHCTMTAASNRPSVRRSGIDCLPSLLERFARRANSKDSSSRWISKTIVNNASNNLWKAVQKP